MAPIRVGFIGLSEKGWAVSALAHPILDTGKYTITAVSTSRESSAAASAKAISKAQEERGLQVDVKPYYGDNSQIANDPNVDLVAISIKTPDHLNAVLPAIDAGKDVFIEWPIGAGLEETQKIADAVREKRVRSLVGLQRRFNPVVAKVKELIKLGRIGKVVSTHVVSLSPLDMGVWGPNMLDNYRFMSVPNNGASLLSIGVGHQLDTLTYVLGPFSSVSATSKTQYPTSKVIDAGTGQPTGEIVKNYTPDQIAITGLLQEGGIVSVIWRSGISSGKGRRQFLWEIDGEDGVIRIESDAINSAYMMQSAADAKVYLNDELVEVNRTDVWCDIKTLFKLYAEGAEGKYPTLEDGLKSKRLIDAIERSFNEGKAIIIRFRARNASTDAEQSNAVNH